METYALIAAYNEQNTVVDVIKNTLRFVDQVIFVNDGSTDKTLEFVKSHFSKEKRVHIISWKKNKGKGYAIIQGFKKFLRLNGKLLVTVDADGQHDPFQIPNVILPVKQGVSDIVIGARILTKSPSRVRIFFNIIVNFIMLLTTGSLFIDVSSGFRAYSRETIRKILPYIHFHDFAIEPQILRAAAINNLKVATIPIEVSYEKGRKSNIWKLAKSYLKFAWFYRNDMIRRIIGKRK